MRNSSFYCNDYSLESNDKSIIVFLKFMKPKISRLKFDPNNKLNTVKFEFRAVVSDGTKDILEKEPGSINLIPLFNGIDNSHIKCGKYSNAALISMYGTYETLSNIKKIADDPIFNRSGEVYCKGRRQNFGNRLYCNDISLPFGGLFVGYHKGESHKTGTGLDILYPSCHPLEPINRNPVVRKNDYDLAAKKGSGDEFKRIEAWTNGVREGLNSIVNILEGDLDKYFASFDGGDGSSWQRILLDNGKVGPHPIVNKVIFLPEASRKMRNEADHLNHIHLNIRR